MSYHLTGWEMILFGRLTMSDKEEILHTDVLGNIITESSKLAVARHNILHICCVLKITDKMLRVRLLVGHGSRCTTGFLVYPSQTVVVDGPELLVYVIKGHE
jgi:hypothetical protein